MGMSEKLLNGIDRVREKPESTRWAIVIALTLIATAGLIVIWISILPQRFAALNEKEGQSQTAGFLEPFESLKKTIDTFRREIR